MSMTVCGSSDGPVEVGERRRPVERLGDAGILEQPLAPEPLDEGDHLARQPLAGAGNLGAHDLELAGEIGVVDPVIEAAPLQRVVDFAGAVGGDDDDRRRRGADRAELGDGHLVVGEDLEEIGLERLVGAVELVDEEHRRSGRIRVERLEQRPADQEALGEDVGDQRLAVHVAGGFRGADLDHLRRVVPLVDGARRVEPLVALEPDQLPAEPLGEDLGDLGLADAGLAFEEQRPAHLERQEQHRRERPVGDVAAVAEKVERGVDGGGDVGHWVVRCGPRDEADRLAERRTDCYMCIADLEIASCWP